MGFSRQEYWSGLPFSSPGALPHPRMKPVSSVSPPLAGGFFTIAPSGKPFSLDCGLISHFLESLQLHIHHSKASFQDKPFNITVIQVYAPTTNAKEAKVERFYEDLQDLLELAPKKHILFITGDQNEKVGSQEIPGVTGKFGLGVQNEAGQRLIEFCQENALVIANTLFQQHKKRLHTWTSPDGQHWNQIILFAAEDGEALYSQQKQDWELTVAQIMKTLLQNSDLNWRKQGKPLGHSGVT